MVTKRLFLALFIVCIGLYSRSVDWIPLATGDALWAALVFLSWGIVLPRKNTKQLFFIALITSFAIEYSQLIRWEWLVLIRQTRIGHLILGQGFLLSDLLAYFVGILIISALDHHYIMKKSG